MSPEDVHALSIPDDEPCDCQFYIDVLHAKSNLRQSDAYHILTIVCGTSLCLMVMAFFAFLMLAAWYERKPSVDTLIVATVFGLFSTMIGVLFGVSQKKTIKESIAMLQKKDD